MDEKTDLRKDLEEIRKEQDKLSDRVSTVEARLSVLLGDEDETTERSRV